ncbi:MAG: D-aminoacyl-tRNA deacylase [Bacteroidota bacterium]|nr:D-aminoacyl-tRNA deacylase [Bacteroidota bacterium]
MRIVIQRVLKTQLKINNEVYSQIGAGLMVLVGIEEPDSLEDIDWLTSKISTLRIFGDEEGKLNLDVNQINGEVMVVSQFTLFASTKKGNRPSFLRSAKPDIAIPLYEIFIKKLGALISKPIQTGQFGAGMKIELVNDGPVTLILDSKDRE